MRSTGVPTPFQLAFEIFNEDCDSLEAAFHMEIHDFRVAENREFFRYPLDRAIRLLQEIASPKTASTDQFSAEDILDRLRARYGRWMRSDVVAVRIVQSNQRVWLETTEEKEVGGYLVDQTIKRSDLAFIVAGDLDVGLFPPTKSVSENARTFVEEFDPNSIVHTTDLFHQAACNEICSSGKFDEQPNKSPKPMPTDVSPPAADGLCQP